MPQAGEKHQHLLRGRVLRLVKDDEGVVQRPPPHVGQRRNLDGAPLGVLLNLFPWKHVVEGVLERAQVRRDLLVKVAGQEAQALRPLRPPDASG